VHERRTVPQVSEVRRLAVVRGPARAGTERGRAGRRRATPRGVTAPPAGPRHGMEKASGREKPRRARAAFDGETRRRHAPTGSGPVAKSRKARSDEVRRYGAEDGREVVGSEGPRGGNPWSEAARGESRERRTRVWETRKRAREPDRKGRGGHRGRVSP
jgi:hypothetical protein